MVLFTPSRLTLARKRRGLRKQDLADRLALSARAVAAFESGEYPPSEETLHEMARVLEFPLAFFSAPPVEEVGEGSVSFRALSAMSATLRDRVLAVGSIAIDVSRRIDGRFRLPPPTLPDLREFDPEAAAEALREEWQLGARPVRNMVHLLELHGVRVFSLAAMPIG